jgi:hypothetical protein
MTDLEICKLIADINGDNVLMMKSAFGSNWMIAGEVHGGYKIYSPLTDDALIFRTAFEKKVKIDYFDECVYIASHRKLSRYRFDKNDISSLRKAICLVIIEDHK